MLRRGQDCFQDHATPADLSKDIRKPKHIKCTETINAFTPWIIIVHPRSPVSETTGSESSAEKVCRADSKRAQCENHHQRKVYLNFYVKRSTQHCL